MPARPQNSKCLLSISVSFLNSRPHSPSLCSSDICSPPNFFSSVCLSMLTAPQNSASSPEYCPPQDCWKPLQRLPNTYRKNLPHPCSLRNGLRKSHHPHC